MSSDDLGTYFSLGLETILFLMGMCLLILLSPVIIPVIGLGWLAKKTGLRESDASLWD